MSVKIFSDLLAKRRENDISSTFMLIASPFFSLIFFVVQWSTILLDIKNTEKRRIRDLPMTSKSFPAHPTAPRWCHKWKREKWRFPGYVWAKKKNLWVLICATLMAHIKNKKNKDPTSIFGLKKLEIFKFLRLFFLSFVCLSSLWRIWKLREFFLTSKVTIESSFFF